MNDNILGIACHYSLYYILYLFLECTEEEFRQKYLTKEWDLKSRRGLKNAEIPRIKDLPKEFDWRNLSAVSSVKNQVLSAPDADCYGTL